MHDINMTLKPQSTDWLSANDQQIWFNKFKSQDVAGLKFNDFERFLEHALYNYCRSFDQKEGAIQKDEDVAFNNQQEMQLFSRFDTRNDHIIDKEEFIRMCQDWLSKIYQPCSALVIVDVQNDFIDGSLALINGPAKQDGAEVVPIINDLVEHCRFDTIVYTQDWHPIDHIGFHANLPLRKYTIKKNSGQSDNNNHVKSSGSINLGEINGNHDNKTPTEPSQEQIDDSNKFKLRRLASKVQVFDTVFFDDGRMEQKLWPVHCVQNSWGAELHPKLKIAPDAVRIYKGTLTNVDAYSAFWDNMRSNETGLRQELKSRKINDLFVCGLALDYCVAASAIDSVNSGFMTFIIDDACRGIDNDEMDKRKDEMLSMGIVFINSKGVKDYLSLFKTEKSIGDKNFQKPSDDDQSIPSSDNVVLKKENTMDKKLFLNICLRRALLEIN